MQNIHVATLKEHPDMLLVERARRQPLHPVEIPVADGTEHPRDTRAEAEMLVTRHLLLRSAMLKEENWISYLVKQGAKEALDERTMRKAIDHVVETKTPRWPLKQPAFVSTLPLQPKPTPKPLTAEKRKLIREVGIFAVDQCRLHGPMKATTYAREFAALRGLNNATATWVIGDALAGRRIPGI
jgi:hypothetical protein